MLSCVFLFKFNGTPRDLHILTAAFPTLRSSDLRLDKQDIAASLALKHRDRGARHLRERRLSGGVGGPVGLIAHMIGLEEAEKVRCGRQIGPLEHRADRKSTRLNSSH